MKHIVEEPIL
jgi:glutathione S-transferase